MAVTNVVEVEVSVKETPQRIQKKMEERKKREN
jgi:hypothetical protein